MRGVEGEDTGVFVSAVLALAACRLRDLGRAARGTLDPEVLSAPHNTVVEVEAEDIVPRPREEHAKRKRQ